MMTDRLLESAVGDIAPTVRHVLLQDRAFAKDAGYRTDRLLTFDGHTFESSALRRHVVKLFQSAEAVHLKSEAGADVELSLDERQIVVCKPPGAQFLLPQLNVFAPDAARRAFATQHAREFLALLPRERQAWSEKLIRGGLSLQAFHLFMSDLRNTPITYENNLGRAGSRTLRLEHFAPCKLDLMDRTVGSHAKTATAVKGALLSRQEDWIASKSTHLLSIAFAAAARPEWRPALSDDAVELARVCEQVNRLGPKFDPFSRIAALDYALAAAGRDARFEELARTQVALHSTKLRTLDDELQVFAAAFLMLHAQSSIEETRVASWAHRRTYAWILASLATRSLSPQIEAKDFIEWAVQHLGNRFRMAVALDKRFAPRWTWSDSDPSQLRSEYFGRLSNVAQQHGDLSAKLGLDVAVKHESDDAEAKHARSFWILPGPLEAEVPRKKPRFPPSVERGVIERLALDDANDAFIGVSNIAKLVVPRLKVVAAVIARARLVRRHEVFDADGHIRSFMGGLTHLANVCGSVELAEILLALLTEAAREAKPGAAAEIFQLCLEAAMTPGGDTDELLVQTLKRVASTCATGKSAAQIEYLLDELLLLRPGSKSTLTPVIAAARLAS